MAPRLRARRLALALILSATVLGTAAGPATAAVILVNDPPHGSYAVVDTHGTPAATCGYGAENEDGVVFFRWLRASAPRVFARDKTAQRDQQKVRWTFVLKNSFELGPWQTIKKASQTRMAYDDTAAAFSALKLFAKRDSRFDRQRAEVKIEWLRPNGTVAGKVRYRIEHYRVDSTIHETTDRFLANCPGANGD